MRHSSDQTTENKADTARRTFLQRCTGVGTALLAPGVFLTTPVIATESSKTGFPGERNADQPVDNSVRWGMLVDANRCTACGDCVKACDELHLLPRTDHPEDDPQWIRIVHVRNRETGHAFSLPMMCQHCAHPPCVDVCPTGASFRREDGIVLVDKHICIGCRYCMMACPYKARSFIAYDIQQHTPFNPSGKGVVESCTFCVRLIDDEHIDGINGTTACAAACELSGNNAILFGDLKDPSAKIAIRLQQQSSSRVRADLGLDTAVHYQGIDS
jgi:molybdopterin-containing oxidoreductase family iron-sulfur binding subunit